MKGSLKTCKKTWAWFFGRMKSSNLKAKMYNLGQESQTKVMILSANRADTEVLKEISTRIESIHLNALVDSTQIEELIQDSNFSPFPQILNTERPDRVITAVNRGKIVIMTDGTPNALITPSTFLKCFIPVKICMNGFISLILCALYE